METENLVTTQVQTKSRERFAWINLLINLLPLFLAIVVWWITLSEVNPAQMTDIGLVSVLPFWFYVSLAIVTASFAIQVYRRQSEVLILAHIAALIFILHGSPQIIYGTLRYAWAWKHVGVVDYIQRHGSVDPTISYLNAYQNWPGFFTFAALINEIAGLSTSLGYAGWGPVFFNLLDLGPLILIYRTLTKDQRLVWLGAWFFYLGNWIGQDYFSPQAMAFFLYLVILAIVLRWFRVEQPVSKDTIKRWVRSDWLANRWYALNLRAVAAGNPDDTFGGLQRIGLMAIVLLVAVVIISSHQLTPFMAISALTLLAIFQVSRVSRLPVLIAVLTVAWIIYLAAAFMQGNMYWIIRSIGLLFSNISNTLINLNQASPGQVFVADIDRGLTALVIVLAVLGFIRRIRRQSWDIPALLLIASPAPLLAANAYGGEMLFRVYFFALPFLAFFIAALFYPSLRTDQTTPRTFAIAGLSMVLLGGFIFSYYGKEQMNYFSPQEVAASQTLHQIAPPGSLLMDGTSNWPLISRNYEQYSYLSIQSLDPSDQQRALQNPLQEIPALMAKYPHAYLTITRSQIAEVDMTHVLPPGSLERLISVLVNSPRFRIVYENPDAVIFTLNTQ